MRMQQSGNPALKADRFQSRRSGEEVMTAEGTYTKAIILLALTVTAAGISWGPLGMSLLVPSLIASIILALVTMFKKEWAMYTAPFYALCEGVLLGSISLMYESRFPGMVQNAVMLTMAVLLVMGAVFRYNIIKVTDKLRTGIIVCTVAIGLVYLASFVMGFFGSGIPMIHSAGPIGIAFSVFVTGLAAFNLLLDFDFIDRASRSGQAGKHMEWYGAFALLVTLVWLYLEILRLLSKLNRR
ncbi:MAG: Bax inhibitor-1/YccA family protein [Halobacteriovoraceae bacterium]|nr:Bax inhibitor-1/YccA family protein [Halobacteriovoraceae bacterium]